MVMISGCGLLVLLLVICVHYGNSNHGGHLRLATASQIRGHPDNSDGGLYAGVGGKKLQQSSNYLPDDEGVKFLPPR